MLQGLDQFGHLMTRIAHAPFVFLQNLVGVQPSPFHTKGQLQGNELSGNWEQGLSSEDVKQRLQQNGENQYRPKLHAWQLFAEQFKSISSLSLLGFAGVALALGKYVDMAVILLVLLIQAGYTTRLKKRSEENYQQHIKTQKKATVLRDGSLHTVSPANLVPGDVILLRQGDVVPADAVIIRGQYLQVREMDADATFRVALKHQIPDDKRGRRLAIKTLSEAHQLYAGSVILSGSARVVITSTGTSTRCSKILCKPKHQQIITEQKYHSFSQKLTKIGWVTILLIGVLVLLFGWPALSAVETASAVATSVIPGGFAFPICLAFWAATRRTQGGGQELLSLHHTDRVEDAKALLLSEQALIQELHPRKIHCGQSEWIIPSDPQIDPFHVHAKECAALIQAAKGFARREGEWGVYERAIDPLYRQLQEEKWLEMGDWKWVDHMDCLPNGLLEKRSFQKGNGQVIEIVRGSAELLLENCHQILLAKQNPFSNPSARFSEISESQKKDLQDWLETARRHNEQTIGFAYRIGGNQGDGNSPQDAFSDELSHGLVWIGAISFQKTYRSSSGLLQKVTRLGLPVILMVDEYVLADSAFRKGIAFANTEMRILSADDFLEELEKKPLENPDLWIVTADERQRITVTEKLRERYSNIIFIGCSDQERALYGAAWAAIEQGIKRGLHEVAEAIEEARHARDRIGHANGFILSGNVGEVVFATIAGLVGAHHALSPLILNVATNFLVSIGLATGRREMDPAQPKQNGDLQTLHKPIFSHGLISGSVALLAYAGGLWISEDPFFASTFAFATLILSQLWQALHWRRQSRIAKLTDLWEDRVLALTWFAALGTLALSVYTPFLSQMLQTTPLGLQDWMAAITLAGAVGSVASKSEDSVWRVIEQMAMLWKDSSRNGAERKAMAGAVA